MAVKGEIPEAEMTMVQRRKKLVKKHKDLQQTIDVAHKEKTRLLNERLTTQLKKTEYQQEIPKLFEKKKITQADLMDAQFFDGKVNEIEDDIKKQNDIIKETERLVKAFHDETDKSARRGATAVLTSSKEAPDGLGIDVADFPDLMGIDDLDTEKEDDLNLLQDLKEKYPDYVNARRKTNRLQEHVKSLLESFYS